MLAAGSAGAVTFTVDSPLDEPDTLALPGTCRTASNKCTLRAAVMQASRTSGVGATIMLPAGTYVLTVPALPGDGESNGDLNLLSPASGSPPIAIVGAGSAVTIIDGNQLARVFRVHGGRIASISGVTIRNGFVTGSGASGYGGGVLNEGTLDITNAVITLNQASTGGGISNGIGNLNAGKLTLTNSVVSHNSAKTVAGSGFPGWGAGVFNNYGGAVTNLTITASTISDNTGPLGGGLGNYGNAKILRTTVSGNTAIDGGGLYNYGSIAVVNSTVSSNNVTNNGGGVYNNIASGVTFYSSTIVFNGADTDRDQQGGIGGGIYTTQPIYMHNSLLAGNTLYDAPIYNECSGTIYLDGKNVVGETSGCDFQGTPGSTSLVQFHFDSLGPLRNNGGPTLTHALLVGSSAIDWGDSFGCKDDANALISTDQRGQPRVSGARCDVGAFEYIFPRIDVDANGKYDALTDGLIVLRYLFGLNGSALTAGALGAGATRTLPVDIAFYLDGFRDSLDVDGNGSTDALTDGLMMLRYLFGLRGTAMSAGAIGAGATRTGPQIEAYIQTLMP